MPLTAYAMAHMRLLQIDQRFKRVRLRHEDEDINYFSWEHASSVGRRALDLSSRDQYTFDSMVHAPAQGDARLQGMEHAP